MQDTLKKRHPGFRVSRRAKLTAPGPELTENQPNLQRYSYIYNDLVDGPQDFIGLVAYSIYKQEKICHVKDFEREHGRAPRPEELKGFHELARNRLDGSSVSELTAAFHEAVDFYLETCKQRGELPNKPYSGKILLRVDPALHAKLAARAEAVGKSLNQYAIDALAEA